MILQGHCFLKPNLPGLKNYRFLKTRPEIGFWSSGICFAGFHGNSKPKPTPFPGKWFSAGLYLKTGILTSKIKLPKIKFWIKKGIQGKFCNLRTELNLTRKPIPMTETRKIIKRTVYQTSFEFHDWT